MELPFDPLPSGSPDPLLPQGRRRRGPSGRFELAGEPVRSGMLGAILAGLVGVIFAACAIVEISTGSGSVALSWGVSSHGVLLDGEVWRLAVAPFVHARMGEVVVVIVLLLGFGPSLEQAMGTWRMAGLMAALVAATQVAHLALVLGDASGGEPFYGLLGPAVALPVLVLLADLDAPPLADFIPVSWAVLFAGLAGVGAVVFLGVVEVGSARLEAHLLAVPLAPVVMLVAVGIEMSRFRWRLESEALAQETVALARMRVERLLRKITAQGSDALSDEERRFLVRASAYYGRRGAAARSATR